MFEPQFHEFPEFLYKKSMAYKYISFYLLRTKSRPLKHQLKEFCDPAKIKTHLI